MKTLNISISALLISAALLLSCRKETVEPETDFGGMTFTASISSDASTRTVLDSAGKLHWNSTDCISVNGVPYRASHLSEDSTTAVFVKAASVADPKPPYKAYYPADLYNNGTPTLPAVQTYNGQGDVSCINPMYAESNDAVLAFSNVCGLIELNLRGNSQIKYIKLKAGNSPLCGPFAVEKDNFGYKAVVSGKNSTVTLNLSDDKDLGGVTLDAAKYTKYYIALPAGRYTDMTLQVESVENVDKEGTPIGHDTKLYSIASDVTVDRSLKYVVHKDIIFTFDSDEAALKQLDACYSYMFGSEYCENWPLLAAALVGNGPTLDLQMGGANSAFNNQAQTPDNKFLAQAWRHAMSAMTCCSGYLVKLGDKPTGKMTEATHKKCKGEALALRGFFRIWLAQTFRNIPLSDIGPAQPIVKQPGDSVIWSSIIADFKEASDSLGWTPLNDEYGRATKGMAKTYLADAYMWMAYRCPEQAAKCYNSAKICLKEVIDSKTYHLNKSFCTLWDPASCGASGGKEVIWASRYDPNGQTYPTDRAYRFTNSVNDYVAFPRDMNLSWEWYAAYEGGDKRRDASCVTASVDSIPEKCGAQKSDYVWGRHPFLAEQLDTFVRAKHPYNHFHYQNSVYGSIGAAKLPSIWCSKYWRTASAYDDFSMLSTVQFYWKRYANVLLDFAECCFRTGDQPKGWATLDELRDRGFGNLEVGNVDDLTRDFLPYYNQYVLKIMGRKSLDNYPIPFKEEKVAVTSAQQYYTALSVTPNRVGTMHTVEAWRVAVNEERRREFAGEFCLSRDMQRSGYMEDHINYNYPKDDGGVDYANYPWTKRVFAMDKAKFVDGMPIPTSELNRNKGLVQNKGY